MSSEIIYEAAAGFRSKRIKYCAEINNIAYRLIVRDADPAALEDLTFAREYPYIKAVLNMTPVDVRVAKAEPIYVGSTDIETGFDTQDLWIPAYGFSKVKRLVVNSRKTTDFAIWQNFKLEDIDIAKDMCVAEIVEYKKNDKIIVRIYRWER